MKSVLILLLGGYSLLFAFSAKAQSLCLAFSPTSISGPVGSTVEVQAIAVTLNDIAGMQFPMLYDDTVLEFQSVSIPNPAPLPSFYYSVPPIVSTLASPYPGKVSLVWFDTLGLANSVPSGTVLFTLIFKIIGTGSTSITIDFSPPPAIVVFGASGNPAAFTNPCVTSADQLTDTAPQIFTTVAPNPFSDVAVLSVNAPEDTDATLFISDLTGKICFQKNMYLKQGITGTEIANTMLQGAGMYFVHLVTNRTHAVQPIVFQ